MAKPCLSLRGPAVHLQLGDELQQQLLAGTQRAQQLYLRSGARGFSWGRPGRQEDWKGGPEGPSCACCFEPQPSTLGSGIGTTAGGSSLFLGPRFLEDCNPPSGEPQLGNSQGLYGLHSDHYPRTDGVKYEGLPCCFYEEKQVAHNAGRGNGCYTEDYSVSVQYTLTEEPPPSCCAGSRDLSQCIPIIPEDVDCDLGLPQDCQGMHRHSPWGGVLGLDVPRLHWSLGTTREEERGSMLPS